MPVSTAAIIQAEITSMFRKIMDMHPDTKHNVGHHLLEAYVWDTVQKFAKGASDKAWAAMEKDGVYTNPDNTQSVKDQVLSVSPKFTMFASVSEPVKRFNADALAKIMSKSKYKVPEATVKEFVEKAKVGKTGNVSLRIEEKT